MTRRVILAFFIAAGASSCADQRDEWLKSLENPPYESLQLQPNDVREKYLSHDFSTVFTPRTQFLGYIGSDYQRLWITFKSITRDPNHSDTYLVVGTSRVGKNTNDFEGTITLTHIREYATLHYGVDDEYKDAGFRAEGIAIGTYKLKEPSSQPHSGEFEGIVTAYWLLDKDGQLRYDDTETFSDNYVNNQYVGSWAAYRSHSKKIANWGEYRIPFSGDLDLGAGEFSPNAKYSDKGW
jgi:hypothetical protein